MTIGKSFITAIMLVTSLAASAGTEKYSDYGRALDQIQLTMTNEGRAVSLSVINDNFSFDDETASHYLNFLIQSNQVIQEKNSSVAARMLCRDGRPKHSINDSYAILEIISDIRISALRKSYDMVSVYFGKTTAGELDAWLETLTDASKATPRSVEDTLIATCGRLHQTQFAGK